MKLNVPVYQKNVNSERSDEPARPRRLVRACAHTYSKDVDDNSGRN